jgi:hypothetical protein
MTHYIYSTHTNAITYVEYDRESGRNHNVIKRRFNVAGGHGVCNKNMITPQGVVTRVDKDEDMDWLYGLDSFKKDINKGFIKVIKRREDPERVVNKDMTLKDGSAPKTPKDYKESDGSNRSYSSTSASAIIL